jgi:hypothetical protein
MYTEEQKKSIYSQWCQYQKENNIPVTEYPYQAYANETYDLWVKVLNNNKKKA